MLAHFNQGGYRTVHGGMATKFAKQRYRRAIPALCVGNNIVQEKQVRAHHGIQSKTGLGIGTGGAVGGGYVEGGSGFPPIATHSGASSV